MNADNDFQLSREKMPTRSGAPIVRTEWPPRLLNGGKFAEYSISCSDSSMPLIRHRATILSMNVLRTSSGYASASWVFDATLELDGSIAFRPR
jgi:hypothetical protein